MDQLVRFTRGYSGREIARLSQEAINHMMAEANPDLGDMVDQGRDAVSSYRMKARPIARPHLNEAFRRTRPRATAETLAKYREWADKQ